MPYGNRRHILQAANEQIVMMSARMRTQARLIEPPCAQG